MPKRKRKKKRTPLGLLETAPLDIMMEILKYLNFETISKLMCTSHGMKNAILKTPVHGFLNRQATYGEILQEVNKNLHEIYACLLQENKITKRMLRIIYVKDFLRSGDGEFAVCIASFSLTMLLLFTNLFLLIVTKPDLHMRLSVGLIPSAIIMMMIGTIDTLIHLNTHTIGQGKASPITGMIKQSLSFFQKKQQEKLTSIEMHRSLCQKKIADLKAAHNPL